ncbi:MAG: ribosome-associated translation inhibitor RaiA [Clostridia bacterium]|nr:ribosome-associated translation inhibitor RaiA [Clostridia bacterium]
MELITRGKNVPVTDALRDYAAKRLGKLERYLGSLDQVQVVFSVEGDRHVAEVTIPLNGLILRGEEETGDMYSSIDLVLEKLEKQIEKHKTKLAKRVREQGLKNLVNANNLALGEAEAEEQQRKIVRTKKFPLKPMSVEEAIMQMNLVGHSFFVFANAETDEINVVYRRRDGNYGLIEPE